jgi:hypothetical protein
MVAYKIAIFHFNLTTTGFVFLMTGVSTISEVNPLLLVEVFLLNGLVGILSGEHYMKDGLVAAMGIYFWIDIVFHVLWGLVKI